MAKEVPESPRHKSKIIAYEDEKSDELNEADITMLMRYVGVGWQLSIGNTFHPYYEQRSGLDNGGIRNSSKHLRTLQQNVAQRGKGLGS
ncbi:unnamed protein product, partial [Ceratitis capitata]